MNFEKLRFEIITDKDGTQNYKINNKYVTESVYNSLLSDDTLYKLPPLPKVKNSPENSIVNTSTSSEVNQFNNVTSINKYKDMGDITNEEECQCSDCEELRMVIADIRDMDDKEALNALRGYIDVLKIETEFQTLIDTYNELGNGMIKLASQLENQLDEFMGQFTGDGGE